VREGVLSLQEAVRKMTSAPAQRLGLKERGLLREGFKADITVFDPGKVKDEATFVDPHRFASGIPYVMVNGELVVDGGEHTGALPGRALRKNR
jgi:N-acyl-D-aspartate/D-glutamate deacylase